MNKFFCIIIGITLTFFLVSYTYAEKETINERLVRVEESIKNLDLRLTQRIEDTNKRIEDTNKRIDILRQDINRPFDDSSKDIDDMRSLIYVVMASLFTIIAMICGLIVYIVKKDRQETKHQPQQPEPLPDLKIIVQKVQTLEKDFREKVIPLWEHFSFKNSEQRELKYA